MDVAEFAKSLFRFDGRLGRSLFWATLVGCALVSGVGEQIGGFVGSLIGLLVAWVFLASVAKRAHDRDKSFWTAALAAVPFVLGLFWFLIIPGALGALALGPLGALLAVPLGWIVFAGWWVIGGIWLVWELGIQDGVPGTNEHGPRPVDFMDPSP